MLLGIWTFQRMATKSCIDDTRIFYNQAALSRANDSHFWDWPSKYWSLRALSNNLQCLYRYLYAYLTPWLLIDQSATVSSPRCQSLTVNKLWRHILLYCVDAWLLSSASFAVSLPAMMKVLCSGTPLFDHWCLKFSCKRAFCLMRKPSYAENFMDRHFIAWNSRTRVFSYEYIPEVCQWSKRFECSWN